MFLARRYRIRGRVQGVGYRYFALDSALRLGVRGYVRNLPGGDVEAVAEAEGDALAQFRAELERGPALSRVVEVVEEELPATGQFASFQIRGS